MHTLAVIAIQADTEEEAINSVMAFLGDNAPWSDWSECGGRWEGVLNGKSVIRYSDDPKAFTEAIDEHRDATADEIDNYVEQLGSDLTVFELVSDIRRAAYQTEDEKGFQGPNLDNVLKGYRAHKLFSVLYNKFTSDSHFYDAQEYTASRRFVDERTKEAPEKQFLVAWDLHY